MQRALMVKIGIGIFGLGSAEAAVHILLLIVGVGIVEAAVRVVEGLRLHRFLHPLPRGHTKG